MTADVMQTASKEPTTEAGRALFDGPELHGEDCPKAYPDDEAQKGKPCECWLTELVKVEEAARAEGRREAPRDPWIEAGDHPESRCQRCGGPNVWSWAAPSPLWNAVMRDPETGVDEYGIVCPPCFSILASLKGIGGNVHDGLPRWSWMFRPDIPDEEIAALWTDRDGRQWDPETWLWGDASESPPTDPDMAEMCQCGHNRADHESRWNAPNHCNHRCGPPWWSRANTPGSGRAEGEGGGLTPSRASAMTPEPGIPSVRDASESPLPPCPICGKPDLFIGRDDRYASESGQPGDTRA